MAAPVIDMSKWGDRQAAPDTLSRLTPPADYRGLKPIVINVSAEDIGRQYAANANRFGKCNPNVFRQFLLEKFKEAGAPVEGTLLLKLAHGAIAKIKDDAPQPYIRYVWMPPEYAVAIANGAGGEA